MFTIPVATRSKSSSIYSTSQEDPQAITDDDSPSDDDFDPPSSKSKSKWNGTRRQSTRRTAVKFTKPEDDKLLYVAMMLCPEC